MEPIDPKFVPKLARKIAKWQRQYGPRLWPMKAMAGTPFFAPPSIPPIVHETFGYEVDPVTGNGTRIPSQRTLGGYQHLVNYYAETLEKAKCFHLSEEMTNLALRAVMPKFKLTREMLRLGPDPSGGIVPWGFITWATPIGQAENYDIANMMVDLRTGKIDRDPDKAEFSPYADADFPVVAASWRYEPEANIVWVAFFTENSDHLRILRETSKMTPSQLEEAKKMIEPLALEREQALPLDRTLNWCDADPKDGPLLEMTAFSDPRGYPEAYGAQAMARNELARPLVSNMVRVLVASWMIMRWKVAHREVVPAPLDVARKISKERGISKEAAKREAGTTLVRLGGPIKKRAAPTGKKEYTWKVRALIGPVIRDRQYIPAWDTYDEEPRWIEPFWAGPPDAPISNADKVFLLGEKEPREDNS